MRGTCGFAALKSSRPGLKNHAAIDILVYVIGTNDCQTSYCTGTGLLCLNNLIMQARRHEERTGNVVALIQHERTRRQSWIEIWFVVASKREAFCAVRH